MNQDIKEKLASGLLGIVALGVVIVFVILIAKLF
jgi:hypothetical protein